MSDAKDLTIAENFKHFLISYRIYDFNATQMTRSGGVQNRHGVDEYK